jgi:hypothetical protein
LPIS